MHITLNITLIIGLMAGFLSTISALPQLVKALITKKTNDLSLGTYILLTIALSLWAVYGYLISDIPLMFWNTVSLIFTVVILTLKLRLDNK